MSVSWYVYATVPSKAASNAIEETYEALGKIVGEDLAEHLDPGEELEPPALGYWPDLSVSTEVEVPTEASDASVRGRLAKCVSVIAIDRPQGFDPAMVSAVRALLGALGPSVFTKGEGSELVTSEALLATLAESPDLPTKLRAVEAGEVDDEDEDEDDEDEDDEDEDDDEPAPDSARPEVLRGLLAAIAQSPRVRRKAGDLLASAPDLVGAFAERLARIGPEPDAVAAKALAVTERDVLVARKALATILRRAEGR